jgi:hypothetical protein
MRMIEQGAGPNWAEGGNLIVGEYPGLGRGISGADPECPGMGRVRLYRGTDFHEA